MNAKRQNVKVGQRGRAAGTAGMALGLTLLCWLIPLSSARAHGDLELRIRDLTRQILSTTNNPATLYLARAELHREHQNWEEAAADYSRAAEANPSLPNVNYYRARMLFESGRLPEALALVESVIIKSPENGRALVLRGQIRSGQGDRKRALGDYERGLAKVADPEPVLFLEWAALQLSEGRTNAAVECLDAGIKRIGPELSLLTRAWDLELESKDLPAALKRADAILELVNRRETWLTRRGEVLLKMGNTAEAKQSFTAALYSMQKLPPRLQQSPAMVTLRGEIEQGLSQCGGSSEAAAPSPGS